ncbi:MAG TPA: hypothetical protein DDY68_04255 [Porphyromonadaceae bacterium]|nr:hypothetical protein [Porphyromonadaceae bacterium]
MRVGNHNCGFLLLVFKKGIYQMKKRILIIGAFVVFALSSFAQQGKFQLGTMFSYGTRFSNLGLGLKGSYGLSNEIRSELSANFFFNTKEIKNAWDMNLNMHYLILASSQTIFYPLIGLALAWDGDPNICRVGVNVGAGFDCFLTDHWVTTLELKYQLIQHRNPTIIGIGIGYRF